MARLFNHRRSKKIFKRKKYTIRQLELNNQVRHLMSSIHQSVKKSIN